MSEPAAGPCVDTCIYSSGGDNPPDVCGTLTVRARKPQTCCECKCAIEPGDTYEVASGKWDGEWASFKTCAPCAEVRRVFCCDGWVYGCLWEDAEEFLETMTMGCVAKLSTAAAKEKLTGMWRRWRFA